MGNVVVILIVDQLLVSRASSAIGGPFAGRQEATRSILHRIIHGASRHTVALASIRIAHSSTDSAHETKPTPGLQQGGQEMLPSLMQPALQDQILRYLILVVVLVLFLVMFEHLCLCAAIGSAIDLVDDNFPS